MALIVILIALAVQRYLHFNSYSHRVNWLDPYTDWICQKVEYVTKGHGLIGLLILVVPALIVVSIIFGLMYNLLGVVGYLVLNVVLLWYCMDGRDLLKEPYEKVSNEQLFVLTYRGLFAVLFWFFVFGPVGLVLYVMVSELADHFKKAAGEKFKSLKSFSVIALGVLDWVPVRLLGLSYALVGHFGAVFKLWVKDLFASIKKDEEHQSAIWGLAAIEARGTKKAAKPKVQVAEGSATATVASPGSSTPASSTDTKTFEKIVALLDRTLLVWLVLIAIITIAYWLG